MQIEITDGIMAVVTTDRSVVDGKVPIFFAANEQEKEKLALYLSRILKGMAHDLENGTYIIVKH